MLIEQTRRADELQERLNEAEEKLKERNILIENAGSIAAAALKLNKVFEAADEAVSQYIESVKAMGSKATMDETPRGSAAPPVVTSTKKSPEPAPIPPGAPVTKVREIKHLKNN